MSYSERADKRLAQIEGALYALAVEQLNRAERWKRDATAALDAWHELEALVPAEFTHGRLGQPWPTVIADYIHHLRTRPHNPKGPT